MEEEIPVYHSCVLLVKDIEKSKHFYNTVLGQKIVMDFGRNVGFEGGLAYMGKRLCIKSNFPRKKA